MVPTHMWGNYLATSSRYIETGQNGGLVGPGPGLQCKQIKPLLCVVHRWHNFGPGPSY